MVETEGRYIRDIHKELVERLGDMVDEYFHIASSRYEQPVSPQSSVLTAVATWPDRYRWIACYAVTGGSEGHYIHVDIVYDDKRRDLVFLGKTFQGMGHAQKMAAKCAEELGA